MISTSATTLPVSRATVISLLLALMLLTSATASAEVMTSGKTWPPAAAVPTIVAPGINGAARFVKSAENVTIGPVVVTDAYRAVETDQGVKIRNLSIVGLTARNLQRDGIRLRDVVGAEIANFDLRMRAEPQTGEHLPEGIAIYAGSDIVIRDGQVSGFQMAPVSGVYGNGDGVATEPKSSGRILRVRSSNNTDGCFDLKGSWSLADLIAEACGKSFRFWNTIEAATLTSIDSGAAVHLASRAVVTIDRLVVRSSKPGPVIITEGKATLTIKACDLSGVAKGSTLVQYNGRENTIRLGTGCALN